MSEKKNTPFVYKFTAGAVAGISEILLMYPLDVVKTRMQLQVSNPGITNSDTMYGGIIDCFTKMIRKEGASKLYKGISSPILMEAPKRATKFATNEEFSYQYKRLFPNVGAQSIATLSGASAGICEAFVVVPFELVKIRLQDRNSVFKGPLDVLRNLIKKEGVFSIYNGLESTLWRQSVWNAGYFGSIFQIRSILNQYPSMEKNVTIRDLIAGMIGGTIGVLLNIPFDVVKSRIQSQPILENGVRKYNWAWPSLFVVYREEGFLALYKGFLPKVVRLGPGGGIMLVVFNGVLTWMGGGK
ncbi:hypothetical protein TBLA_0B04020 [Henningerozyma blattae CBS 6284]|uniref:Mitochondrial 2-oxodicarboxylate carrier 1 n=1 Tax=Henningerozyma blattae (strain ATCC 34711 / CBS 6284 / DSM 70876 / NBRC 10599 / NRRL Y-10934 / UCD 77-7) TaxID=1071380 RepID=I2GYN8_HENB6|nr:hypothetical protein TBLA_0B04020 [Tetrapisispora blattae CBS 6284]CCH59240.1 hypothetical protein TBLA_0B04020 [Tetrapisispora blattae CBS 6284]